jgi:hypothetical protein
MIFPWDTDPEVPWNETQEAKVWARCTFQSEPPYLHSPERNRVLQAIAEDEELIDEIYVQSFWNDDDDDQVLITRIRALKVRVAQNTALIAPWRLLPTELQSLIFEYTGHMRHLTEMPTPIGHVVSQVCRRWREVALSTPKCWSDISIYDSRLPSHLLERWLERSKTLPLNIILFESSIRHVQKMRLLLWHFNRVECLKFTPRPRFHNLPHGIELEDSESNSPTPVLPKLLEGANRLKHLILPYGLTRGSRIRSMQVSLPALETISGIETYELIRNFKSATGLKSLAVCDSESKCEFTPLISQCARAAPDLEVLDLTNWSVILNEERQLPNPPTLPALNKLLLPRHHKAIYILDRQAEMFPSLTLVSLYSAESVVPIPLMPTVKVIRFRQNKPNKPSEPNIYDDWLLNCPNLRIIILEAIIWVHIHTADSPSLLQDLYNNAYMDEFSWGNLDQARLYAWPHTWCISIAKKRELRLYEHALADIRPTSWIDEHMFPYTISLCWVEFEEKIKAITAHAKKHIEEEPLDSESF